MEIRSVLDTVEKELARYRILVGVLVLIMLIITCVLTYQNFDKQNQIIKTGGFVDGKVKCVCSAEAWEEFQANGEKTYVSTIDNLDG
jgi:uncharacterized protein YxeA